MIAGISKAVKCILPQYYNLNSPEQQTLDMKHNKSDKQIFQISPLKFKKKDKLLSRWTDGLFYFVKVTKVTASSKMCMVEFEDKSTANVHFKDLLEEKEDGAVQCHYCGKEETTSSNQLIRCSNCERDFHQNCHIPAIQEEDIEEKFVCRICVFASCAQAGGAKSTGPLAEKFAYMRQFFPYDIKQLTWNPVHTSNDQQCFCYCGGPGIWYNKMLQCCRCLQWFHEACIQSVKEELLLGDRFFIFVCAHCNEGLEFLTRMDLDWFSIAHIATFHLVMTNGTTYADLDTDIIPFIMDRAQNFGLKKLLNGMHGNKDAMRRHLINIFKEHVNIFRCGSEVKKRCTYFGVRQRTPPSPPPVSIPAIVQINVETLKDSFVKKTTFFAGKFTQAIPYAKKVDPPTMSARLKESKLAKIARVKSEHNYCTPVKCPEDSPSRKPRKSPSSDIFDGNNNSPARQSPLKPDISETLYDREDVKHEPVCKSSRLKLAFTPEVQPPKKRFWSLDTAFPEPVNFLGANNPFLIDFEQENIRKKRKHFEEQLSQLSDVLFPEEQGREDFKGVHITSPPLATAKDIKGFKGELADLINSSSNNTPNVVAPRRQRSSPSESDRFSERPPKTSPSHNGISPKRHPSSSRTSSVSPRCVNGVSPVSKTHLRNGFVHSSPSTKGLCEADKETAKKLKALNKCLKNLSPTCGFHFPVLDESHPSAVSSIAILWNNTQPSASTLTPASSSHSSRHSKSNSHSKKKINRKRKSVETHSDREGEDKFSQSEDSLRRSHRSRHTVKRFEASLSNKSYELFETMSTAATERISGDQYEVISLRTKPEDEVVEYLVNWS